MNVVIPTATGENFNSTITLFLENALGQLRVRAASGTINGATSLTIAAATTGLLVLRSNGAGGWATERSSGGGTTVVAGDSLAFSGSTLNYTGTTDTVAIAGATGNLGTIDISALVCGGSVRLSTVVGDWQIEGFTAAPAKPDGFWFFFVTPSTNFVGNLMNEAAGTLTDSLRMFNSGNIQGFSIHAHIQYAQSRWRVAGQGGADVVQSFTTGGTTNDLALNANTTVLRVDPGGVAWTITGFTGGWHGRRLRIMTAANSGALGTLSHLTGSAAGNQLVMAGNADFGPTVRCAAEFVYDGTDSVWRSVATNSPLSSAGGLTQDQILNLIAFRA
jgi:hypothetical protein